ncbi:MAG: chloride channel protein [Candidatus Krumholzibacteriota bacterium]|nr:chloride channel protein [Candidatus Krumholzibacteriota bacterium]
MSTLIGGAGAAVVAAFDTLLGLVIRTAPRILPGAPYLTPALGAVLVGYLILKPFPAAGGEGVPNYLIAVNRDRGKMRLRDALMKFPATILTLGCGGSGGIVGPLAHIGAGIGVFITKYAFRLTALREKGDLRMAAICGVSGTVSAIFHCPLGGGFFAAEILRRESMSYTDIFPAVMTGCVSFMVSAFGFGREPIFQVGAPAGTPPGILYAWLPLQAVIAGGMGMLFVFSFEKISTLLRRVLRKQPYPALAGSLFLCLLWFTDSGSVLSTSTPLFARLAGGNLAGLESSLYGGQNLALFLLLLVLLKIIATSFTVGSGMSGGFTGPLIVIGVGTGAMVSSVLGINSGSVEYYVLLACSTAGIMAAALNVPLAAILITARMFGYSYMLAAFIGSILAFLIFKNKTIYAYAATRWPCDNGEQPGRTRSEGK